MGEAIKRRAVRGRKKKRKKNIGLVFPKKYTENGDPSTAFLAGRRSAPGFEAGRGHDLQVQATPLAKYTEALALHLGSQWGSVAA
jgi:hypothetical protein